MKYKQVILVRGDLKLSRGKLATQAAHASFEAGMKSERKKLEAWRDEGAKKVVLKVRDEKELTHFFNEAKKMGFAAALIKDAGHTEVKPGTITAVGIGPDEEKEIDKLTGKLKTL
ncbi:MAG: peptidyl-tRNA hydrolase Pth2 [Nanoarchaeota archaeon]